MMKKELLKTLICLMLITTVVSTVESLDNNIKDTTALQPLLTNMMGSWTELQKLLASDGAANDWFGYSVSLYQNTAIIGAPKDDDSGQDSGSAYVYTYNGTTWIQQAKLRVLDGATNHWFGFSVSLNGDTALIGAPDEYEGDTPGIAYVFIRTGSNWTQQAKLFASDGAAGDNFGYSVFLNGDTALIGAFGDDSYKGSTYVFTRTGSTWTQQQKLIASDGETADCYGCSVSLSGNTAIIGAYLNDEDKLDSGSAYVYTYNGTTWVQQAKLRPWDDYSQDLFGWAVSLNGNTALIGTIGKENNKGSAYIFTRTGSTWTQKQQLTASDGAKGDVFGYSVSLNGNTAIIAAAGDESYTGSTYVFTRSGSTWVQKQKLTASDGTAMDSFGCSVCLGGDTNLIGAYQDDDDGTDSGSVYVFTTDSENQPPIFGTPFTENGSTGNPVRFIWSIPINDPDGNTFDWTIQCSNGQANNSNDAVDGTKSLELTDLAFSTTYKIWVNATDPIGSGSYTRKWYTFTTRIYVPPSPPTITGPAKGKIGVPTDYNFMTTNTEGDLVYYFIDWGDNTNSDWIGPYQSGVEITESHIWFKKGDYTIKAKAKDIYDGESDWGTLTIKMPYLYNIPFLSFWEKLFERFPLAFPILRYLMGY
jgi:hypothetical protein